MRRARGGSAAASAVRSSSSVIFHRQYQAPAQGASLIRLGAIALTEQYFSEKILGAGGHGLTLNVAIHALRFIVARRAAERAPPAGREIAPQLCGSPPALRHASPGVIAP
jgi:hypothetical protein